jgi:hypothetical protein
MVERYSSKLMVIGSIPVFLVIVIVFFICMYLDMVNNTTIELQTYLVFTNLRKLDPLKHDCFISFEYFH